MKLAPYQLAALQALARREQDDTIFGLVRERSFRKAMLDQIEEIRRLDDARLRTEVMCRIYLADLRHAVMTSNKDDCAGDSADSSFLEEYVPSEGSLGHGKGIECEWLNCFPAQVACPSVLKGPVST